MCSVTKPLLQKPLSIYCPSPKALSASAALITTLVGGILIGMTLNLKGIGAIATLITGSASLIVASFCLLVFIALSFRKEKSMTVEKSKEPTTIPETAALKPKKTRKQWQNPPAPEINNSDYYNTFYRPNAR